MIAFVAAVTIAVGLWWIITRPTDVINPLAKSVLFGAGIFVLGWLEVMFIFGVVAGAVAFGAMVVASILLPVGGER